MDTAKKAVSEAQVQGRQQGELQGNLLEYTGDREIVRKIMLQVRKSRVKG